MSLRMRLGIASLAVSLVFLGLVGVVLDRSFREAARQGVQERLQARVYTLLGVMEVAGDGRLQLPADLPEARFSSPASGLYARVLDARGQRVWRSSSLIGNTLPPAATLGPGQIGFDHHLRNQRAGLFLLRFGFEWEDDDGNWWRFTLDIAETDTAYRAQVNGFRQRLWTGLGAAGLALLGGQLLVLGWGLRPLLRVARELAAVQAGSQAQLGGGYPRELAQLTERINRFIDQQQSARERYRNSLGDLAHSLKTPMAVLLTALERSEPETAREQINRMREIVDYQLGRARTVGRTPLTTAVPIARAAASVKASLDKVHAARGIRCTLDIADGLGFRGDRGDLLELLGNLLDNAYKWAASQVEVRVETGVEAGAEAGIEAGIEAGSKATGCLIIQVEDDGPGVASDQAARLLRRGQRGGDGVGGTDGSHAADRTPIDGHGIGLAVVREVAAAYGGTVRLERGRLGGLRVQLKLPGAGARA